MQISKTQVCLSRMVTPGDRPFNPGNPLSGPLARLMRLKKHQPRDLMNKSLKMIILVLALGVIRAQIETFKSQAMAKNTVCKKAMHLFRCQEL